jgi:hypothetical protein
VIHAAVRLVACVLGAIAAFARGVREFWFGGQRRERFVGSTLQDSDPAYAPTRVLLAWPRRKDRP